MNYYALWENLFSIFNLIQTTKVPLCYPYHHKLSKYFRIAELGEFFSSPKNCDIIINIFFNCFKMFQNGL